MADTDLPTREPEKFTAGDFVSWLKEYEEVTDLEGNELKASDGWTLSYALVNSSGQITFDATADGDDYLVELSPSTTANYSPGIYKWQAYVTKDDERYTIDSGTIEILPNYATQTSGYDDRSDAQKIYEACEALLLNKATKGQAEMLVGGEVLSSFPLPRLLELRDKYKAIWEMEKRQERINNGLGHPGNIYVRFTDA
ncbi:MAG: hypothetical protein JRH08_00665 [Deltaproteobacteria bacterium]|nr:hypothetical protein [Deltaproteobacteria bacterium]MBW2124215.1 hypothetical protein [Deltaproteobacteria bacterium]